MKNCAANRYQNFVTSEYISNRTKKRPKPARADIPIKLFTLIPTISLKIPKRGVKVAAIRIARKFDLQKE